MVLSGCGQETPVTTTRLTAFDQQVDLSLVGVAPQQARDAAAALQQELTTLQQDWHAWEPGPMGRVNQLLVTGEPFVAPPSIIPLVRLGQDLEARSGGLFNPAIGYIIDLWGFHADSLRGRPPPPTQQIARLVEAKPSMADIEIRGLELQGKNTAIKLDFDNITPGYALDLSMERLRGLGIKSAFMQIGGAVRVIGDRAGQPWRTTIRRASGSGVLAIVPMRGNEGLVTKADYDRNFVFKGELDPRTGRPARGLRSASVLHEDATTAAAAATALLIAGVQDAPAVARQMGIRYLLLVDAEGTLHMNPAMAERIELVDTEVRTQLTEELVEAPATP